MTKRYYRVEIYTECEPFRMKGFREALDNLGDRYFDDWDFYVMDASTGDEIEYGDE